MWTFGWKHDIIIQEIFSNYYANQGSQFRQYCINLHPLQNLVEYVFVLVICWQTDLWKDTQQRFCKVQ